MQIVLDFLKSQWKGILCGLAIGLLLFASRHSGNLSASAQVNQSEHGEVKAEGKVKIAAIPARPAMPCPESKVCPPCPEQPAIEVDFGSKASGGQNQGVTATASANSKDLGLWIGLVEPISPMPIPSAAASVTYKDYMLGVQYGSTGIWSVGAQYQVLAY